MDVRYLGPARVEPLETAAYYESEATDLVQRFLDEVDQILDLQSSHPEIGTPHFEGTRRLILAGFSFDLVYLVEGDAIVVVSLSHHRRKPGYWRDRA